MQQFAPGLRIFARMLLWPQISPQCTRDGLLTLQGSIIWEQKLLVDMQQCAAGK